MICTHEGCLKRACFGLPGNRAKYCSVHKTAEMVDLKSKFCEQENCKKRPNYGLEWRKPTHCKLHKTALMAYVTTIRCQYTGCEILNPNYGPKGGKGRWCKQHKTADMVNVKSTICEYTGCDKPSPAYDFPGQPKTGRFCAVHKEKGMIDLRNPRCYCGKLATFGIKGAIRECCKEHKGAGMVDVSHPSCAEENCEIRPNYNMPGNKSGLYCRKHMKLGMTDMSASKCYEEGCDTRALYGIPGNKRSHCFTHRKLGMIKRPNSKCSDCENMAVWGTNWIPTHCEMHKLATEVNLVEKPCGGCGLLYILDKDGNCESCNPAAFATVRLAKQNALMSYLDTRGLALSTDKTVDGGICGKERPDRIYEFHDKIVIVECDEEQHKDRICLCEQTRMVNIGQSFGGMPVYFIRFNPDDYIASNSRKIPEDIKKRYKLLGDLLGDIAENRAVLPTALVSALYMYYDDWSSLSEEPWRVLMTYESGP